MSQSGQADSYATFSSRFWKRVLGLLGWTVDFRPPDIPRYVLIIAPHTSNWDFLLGVAAKWALRLDVRYLAKDSLFNSPLGWFFRKLGGIPVNRDSRSDLSQQLANVFAASERLVLVIAPEGTRSATDHWKSGFWHIARAAGVPVVMVYFDYSKKQVGGGEHFLPGEDIDADFRHIEAYYSSRHGRRPDKKSQVKRRRGESEAND